VNAHTTAMPAAPSPRLGPLFREAIVSAWKARIPSGLVVFIVAAVCATTLVTVGRTAAAEAQVAERMESAGARELRVTDASQELLTPTVLHQASGLSVVERAIGFGVTLDVTNAAVGRGGLTRPAATVTHGLTGAIAIESGRAPRPGEALVTTRAMSDLGLQHPAGAVTDTDSRTYPIVGSYTPRDPFTQLNSVIIHDPAGPTRAMTVISTSAAQSTTTQDLILRLIDPPDPDSLQIRSPVTLAQVQQEVVGDLSRYGQGLLLTVLGTGGVLVTAVVLADTLVRRTDLGRRRALGAPRWMLIVLVLARTASAALIGAALGTSITLAALLHRGYNLPTTFAIGAAALAVLAATISALLPAFLAAWKDPVRVLRTP